MTASPHRPRSQNTATSPNSERLRPANGPSRVDDSRLRALPPTLFRLRNLRVPHSGVIAFDGDANLDGDTSLGETGYDSTPGAVEAIPTNEVNTSSIETREKESQEIAGNTSTQRSLVSRLSSQSLVLFVILAIAITGIVIGNRGGEQVAGTDRLLKESLLADLDAFDVDLGTASDVVAPDGLVLANDDPDTSSSSTTKHADLALKTDSENLAPNTFVQTNTANVVDRGSAPSSVNAEIRNSDDVSENSIASAALPTSDSQDSAMTDFDQQQSLSAAQASLGTPTSLAPRQGNIAARPAVSSEEAHVVNTVAATSQMPTANATSGYVQTKTPGGVNDWLRYLPSVDLEMEQPATVAVSDTPQNPIAIYQQYLDSIPLGNTQATAPVGYLQDNYQADTVGTQAKLPVSTSSTQRR